MVLQPGDFSERGTVPVYGLRCQLARLHGLYRGQACSGRLWQSNRFDRVTMSIPIRSSLGSPRVDSTTIKSNASLGILQGIDWPKFVFQLVKEADPKIG